MRGLYSLATLIRSTNNRNFQNPVVTLSLRRFSVASDESSIAAFYLREKCGLSANSALLAAKHARFHTSDRADKVFSFFTDLGFSSYQLSRLIRAFPQFLLYPDPSKVLTPKIEFFLSKGISSTDFARVVCMHPRILNGSLKDTIIPHFNYFKSLLGSDDAVIYTFKRYPDILVSKPESYVEPNIIILRQFGVPESRIMFFLSRKPRSFNTKPDKFSGVVEEVRKMGCDPLKLSFVMAVGVKLSISKSTWEKINMVMDMLVNKLGWSSSTIAKFPVIIALSLKKRIIPRYEVIRVLLSKGLIGNSVVKSKLLIYKESSFLEKFVVRYEKEVPELLKLYQKHMSV
ncbi:hypothetical protein ACFE04_012825 [Oxalis oulophora]